MALFDFQGKDKALGEMGALVRDLVEARLTGTEHARLVTRTEIDRILEEQKINLAGITEESAPQVGRLLGAEAMLVGRVFTVGDQLHVTARLFSAETSRSYAESVNGGVDEIERLAGDLADKITTLLAERSETLVTRVQLSRDQVQELKTALGTEDAPKIFVSIREQTVAIPTIDPAAQTEFQNILLKAGAESVKDKSGVLKTWVDNYHGSGGKEAPPPVETADMLIVGEGISEFASRNGDLVSFRARLEIEILNASTGKVLAADREVATAVDLSNQVAAKQALQDAAARLAFRMLPEAVEKWRREKSIP